MIFNLLNKTCFLDLPIGEEWSSEKSDFQYVRDLVKFIREHFGDYFVICLAGKSRWNSFQCLIDCHSF